MRKIEMVKNENGTTRMSFHWEEKAIWHKSYFMLMLRQYLGFTIHEYDKFMNVLKTQGSATEEKKLLWNMTPSGSEYVYILSFNVEDENMINDITELFN